MEPQDTDKEPGETMHSEAISKLAAAAGAQGVHAALKRASETTGAGFELLYNMARRESSLDPTAQAKTSSAAGLFQFIEQTWLAAVKSYGDRHGLGGEAATISKNASGQFVVADPARREEILALRFDPMKSAALAGELVEENRAGLERRLGRAVEAGEVYAAHFLGVGGAAKLLAGASNAIAADFLPKAAAANRAVFYDGPRAKTVGEVIASMAKSMGADAPSPSAASNAPTLAETALKASVLEDALALSRRPRTRVTGTEGYEPALSPRPEKKSALAAATLSLADATPGLRPLLSPIALAALQAIDPARLGAARDRADDR